MHADDRARGVFCNRTLNMRRIRAVGYDMDYTLLHYRMREWEERAYTYLKERLGAEGWPVEDLEFDPEMVIRGLILDIERGNVVKANRFGYVKRAFHGTRPLAFDRKREVYQRTLIELEEPRWVFLNTLFSVSEACIYMQLVDLLDEDRLAGSMGYEDLYRYVRRTLDETHMEGRLKREIVEQPERFVELDEDVPLTLLDQRKSGKKVVLITNSGWQYASSMLAYAFDPFLPGSMEWEDLFDLAIVGARKPEFFSHRAPAFRVETEDGLLREHRGTLESDHVYVGGNAQLVEESLGLRGEEILYVGDHLFVDVNVSKDVLRWRTALVLRELEAEMAALAEFRGGQRRLSELMASKSEIERRQARRRLMLQRLKKDYGPTSDASAAELEESLRRCQEQLEEIDEEIIPLARTSNQLENPNWGLIMRTGKDKSLFARQVERYADVYTSRVSNFLEATPFVYFRSHRGSFPHDEPAGPDAS